MLRRSILATAALVLSVTALPARAADRDGDGMPTRWERAHGLDPTRPDAERDPDRDRLRNLAEYRLGTDPRSVDSDSDGLRDGAEVRRWGSDPAAADALVGIAVAETVCDPGGAGCGERPFPGGVVYLRTDEGTDVDRDVTDARGRFALQAPPGDYVFASPDPAGFVAPGSHGFTHQGLAARVEIVYGQETSRGVVGWVAQAPTCAPQAEFDTCEEPLSGVSINVENDAGDEIASAVTDAGGRYAFSLPPGSYTLVAEPPGTGPFPTPPDAVSFTLTDATLYPLALDLRYDTGIR